MARRRVTILVAEDDPHMSRAFARALRSRNCDVETCIDGLQAVEIASAAGSVDGAILDVRLEGRLSGLDVLERLRANDIKIPCLVVTAEYRAELTRRAHALSGVLCAKPLAAENYDRFLEEVLRRRSRVDSQTAVVELGLARLAADIGEALTATEKALIAATCDGMDRAEFARLRGVTVNTLETQTRRLLAKTDEKSISALAIRVLRLGIQPVTCDAS